MIVSPSRHSVRNSAYTGLTRTVEDVRVVIDRESYGDEPIEGLIRDWSRTSDKRTAWSQVGETGRDQWARWKSGRDARGRKPDDASRTVPNEPEPDLDQPDATPAPATPYAPPRAGTDVSDDIDRRDRDADAEIEFAAHGATTARDAARDRDAARAAEAEDREASESLMHDVDVPQPPSFGDIEAMIERRRHATARWREEQLESVHDAAKDEGLWIDLDALREQRMRSPEPEREPPDLGIGR